MVVVCESPSFAEVANGYPAFTDTGSKIFNAWRSSQKQARLKKSQFKYEELASNEIYVTNLVRCQADWVSTNCHANGERLLTSFKDRCVKNAWPLNRDFLAEELQKIAKLHKGVSVLFACGVAFDTEVEEATKFAAASNLKWLVSFHPSRLVDELSWHYDPMQWGDRQGTFPSGRSEKNEKTQTESRTTSDDEPTTIDDADES